MSEPTPLLKPLAPAVGAPQLWKAGKLTPDTWRAIGDEEPVPDAGHAILSLKRWRAEQAALSGTGLPLGIRAEAGEMVDPAGDFIAQLALVALAFPKFSDGRAYSVARRLREHGFAGEIRATGDVLLDQIPLMLRAGFDAFQIVDAATVKALRESALPAVTRIYQGSGRAIARFPPGLSAT